MIGWEYRMSQILTCKESISITVAQSNLKLLT